MPCQTELFPKELMLIKQVNEKSMTFVTIGIFRRRFNRMSAMGIMMY